jgi:hypothetical protein
MSKVCKECNIYLDITLFRKGHNQCKKCEILKRMCIHNKIKSRCRDCGGGTYCDHDKRRSNCDKCGGGSICEHNKIKTRCIECKGGSICTHKKRRTICSICEGGSICEHKKRKWECIECNGSQICVHKKIKNSCIECDGSQICVHKKIKNRCTECDGRQICEHKINKHFCKECKGSGICIHDKRKYTCIICSPDCGCIDCKSVFVDKRSNCYPLCQACFCNKYPGHEKSTLYKIKERYLRDELRIRFPLNDINMIFDKAVVGGCSKKRPDVLIDLLLYSIIIECDEGQHKNYECENKRIMQLFEDLGNRPLIIIRFNPDNYTENNNKVEGCFKPLTKIEDIHKKKFYDINEEEWKRRIDILEEVIRGKITEDIPEKEITEIKLFYDCY